MSEYHQSYCYKQRNPTGAILKMMRRTRRLTQSELSETLCVRFKRQCSVSQISRFESGESKQPTEFVLHCCDIYGYHPITFAMCLFRHDLRWWRIMLTLNMGQYIDQVLRQVYVAYGNDLMLLRDSNWAAATEFVVGRFDAAIDRRRSAHSSNLD